MKPQHACSRRVYANGGSFMGHRCSRNGTVFEDENWWCKQHAPSSEKARSDQRHAEWEAKWASKQRGWERDALFKAIARAGIEQYERHCGSRPDGRCQCSDVCLTAGKYKDAVEV